MNAGSLKWFIVLSVAVHAVVLISWTREDMEAGNPGHVMHLDIVETAGTSAAIVAMPAADTATQPARSIPDTMVKTAGTPAIPPPAEPETGDSGAADRVAASSPVENREPSPAMAASSPEPSRQESDRHLRNRILELVATNLKYPPLARRKGWQGTVVLKLHIEANGRISRLRVNETSGYPVLDRAAVESLQLASVTQAGEWLHGMPVDIMVPVEYRLVGS